MSFECGLDKACYRIVSDRSTLMLSGTLHNALSFAVTMICLCHVWLKSNIQVRVPHIPFLDPLPYDTHFHMDNIMSIVSEAL